MNQEDICLAKRSAKLKLECVRREAVKRASPFAWPYNNHSWSWLSLILLSGYSSLSCCLRTAASLKHIQGAVCNSCLWRGCRQSILQCLKHLDQKHVASIIACWHGQCLSCMENLRASYIILLVLTGKCLICCHACRCEENGVKAIYRETCLPLGKMLGFSISLKSLHHQYLKVEISSCMYREDDASNKRVCDSDRRSSDLMTVLRGYTSHHLKALFFRLNELVRCLSISNPVVMSQSRNVGGISASLYFRSHCHFGLCC